MRCLAREARVVAVYWNRLPLKYPAQVRALLRSQSNRLVTVVTRLESMTLEHFPEPAFGFVEIGFPAGAPVGRR